MMYKNKKGFSLAELLISLLIISIVLAAAIPTITRRNAHSPEFIWQWSGDNNSAYYGVGANQSAIIGHYKNPDNVTYFDTDEIEYDEDHILAQFGTKGDKLALIKRYVMDENKVDNFRSSHISLYNINSDFATTNEMEYAGRLAADGYNLALGIGTLASMNARVDGYTGYNTAIGQYSLLLNTSGEFNTGLGYGSLKHNQAGKYNTALGYRALSNSAGNGSYYQSKDTGSTVESGTNNTAVGSDALAFVDTADKSTHTTTKGHGSENTAVGASALKYGTNGVGNTAVGSNACASIEGEGNICIGRNTGLKSTNSSAKDYIAKIKDNYGLYIGQDPKGAPLIWGHTSFDTDDKKDAYNIVDGTEKLGFDKELNVNAKYFRVRTYDGGRSMFEVITKAGEDSDNEAYSISSNFARFSILNMSLKDIQGKGSILMTVNGSVNNLKDDESGMVNIYSYDPYDSKHLPINVNDMVRIFEETEASNAQIKIATLPVLDINGAIQIQRNGTDNSKPQTFIDKPILSINNSGDNQEMHIYAKKDSSTQKKIASFYKGAGTIHFAPTGFSIGEKDSTSGNYSTNTVDITAGGAININSGEYVSFNNGGIVIGQDDISIAKIEGLYGSKYLYQTLYKMQQDIEEAKQLPIISDIRLKNVSGDNTAGLKEINALEVKNYTYKNDKNKTPHVGVIAQQLQKVFPNSVFEDNDGYLKIKTEEIFYAMVNSIKELFAQIQDLTAKVVGLDKRITELEKENAQLKQQNEEFEKRLTKLEAKLAN